MQPVIKTILCGFAAGLVAAPVAEQSLHAGWAAWAEHASLGPLREFRPAMTFDDVDPRAAARAVELAAWNVVVYRPTGPLRAAGPGGTVR